MRPLVCLITDRGRLGIDWEDALVDRVREAGRAGVHLIQIRERDLAGGALLRLTERCVHAVRGTATRVVVNDRFDVALRGGAHGVHLRGDSMSAVRVRRHAPAGFLVGQSVHGVEDAAAVDADGAVDYLIFGHVFETVSKPGRAAAGPFGLAAVAAATAVPVLAVGGVTAETAGRVARAGASGIAAIGLFSDTRMASMQRIVDRVTAAFDTCEGVP